MTDAPDPLAEARAERIKEMVGNLLPRIRPLSGNLSEDELLEAAAYMAVYRVVDEEATRGTDPEKEVHPDQDDTGQREPP